MIERVGDQRPTVAELNAKIASQATTIAEMKREHDAMVRVVDEMSHKLDNLYRALMEPQAGQDRSLLDRVGRITVAYESGGIISGMVVRVAGLIIAVGAIAAAMRFTSGTSP